MNQTKLESLAESIINILIGSVVAIVSQHVVFPIVGIHVPLSTHLEITFWFTLVSVARSYIIRRWFNAGLHRAAVNAARLFVRRSA